MKNRGGTTWRCGTRFTWLLAAVTGGFEYLAHPGIGWWPLGFLAFVPLGLAWEERDQLLPAVFYGGVAAFVAWGLALRWVPGALMEVVGADPGSAWFAAFMATTVQCLPLSLAGGAYRLLRNVGCAAEWALPAAVVLAEVTVPTLVPYSHAAVVGEVPVFLQLAPWGGRALISASVLYINGVVISAAQGWQNKSRPTSTLVTCLLLSLVTLTFGVVSLEREDRIQDRLRVGLVQVAGDVTERIQARRESYARHIELTHGLLRRESVDLVVWGETTFLDPVEDSRAASDVSRMLTSASLLKIPVPLITGAAVSSGVDDGFYNSVLLLEGPVTAASRTWRYDKQRLVLFAEGVPERWSWLARWFPWMGPYSVGPADTPLVLPSPSLGERRIGALVCFEALFPERARHLVRAGAEVLINVVDEGWIRNEEARRAHAALVSLSALETGRALVRLNTGGPSVVIDRFGRRFFHLPEGLEEAAIVVVPLSREPTLFVRFGPYPCLLVLGSLALGSIRRTRARITSRQT